MGGRKSRRGSRSGPKDTSAESSSNSQSAPPVPPDSNEVENSVVVSSKSKGKVHEEASAESSSNSQSTPDSNEAENLEIVSSKGKGKARKETAESSSNSQPEPPVLYPQLPPSSNVSEGSSASPEAKDKTPVRDPEVLSDAPPLPGSQQTTPPIEPEEPADRRRYIPPEDDWPPGWMDNQKEDTSPLLWPLDREGWKKFLLLSTRMASKKLKPKELAIAISGSGIWDVSHPHWDYENCWIQWHPDRVQGRIQESNRAIGESNGTKKPLDKALEAEIIERAHNAWISKMPGMVHKMLNK